MMMMMICSAGAHAYLPGHACYFGRVAALAAPRVLKADQSQLRPKPKAEEDPGARRQRHFDNDDVRLLLGHPAVHGVGC